VVAAGFFEDRFVERARRAKVGSIAWIVADWMVRERRSAAWGRIREKLGGDRAPRPMYAWAFRRLGERAPEAIATRVLRTARPLETRKPSASRSDLAETLSLPESALADQALWVDTGAEQLVIPIAEPGQVREAKPIAELLARHARSEKRGASMAYLWAREPRGLGVSPNAPGAQGMGENGVVARFFFLSGDSVLEDPATGSACANLGGWMIATGVPLPLRLEVRQGEAVKRPSLLHLEVDAAKQVFVSGRVIELGRGTVTL